MVKAVITLTGSEHIRRVPCGPVPVCAENRYGPRRIPCTALHPQNTERGQKADGLGSPSPAQFAAARKVVEVGGR